MCQKLLFVKQQDIRGLVYPYLVTPTNVPQDYAMACLRKSEAFV